MRIKILGVVILTAFTLVFTKATAANVIAAATHQIKPPPPPPPPPGIHVRSNPFRHHHYVRSHHRIRLHLPPRPPGLPPPPPRP